MGRNALAGRDTPKRSTPKAVPAAHILVTWPTMWDYENPPLMAITVEDPARLLDVWAWLLEQWMPPTRFH